MTEQRKPIPWSWWTLAVLMLLVAYPLSMGPAMWLLPDNASSQLQYVMQTAYCPILHCMEHKLFPAPLRGMAFAYLGFWNEYWGLDLWVPL